MSSSAPSLNRWAKAPVAFAIALTALGAVLAACWYLIAGLVMFSTQAYGWFIAATATTAMLIASPVLAFKLASKGKPVGSLAATLPVLLTYCALLIGILSH